MKYRTLALSFLFMILSSVFSFAQEAANPKSEHLTEVKALNFIHHTNNLEIMEATAALPKLTLEEVRNFAQELIDDHTLNEQTLKALAEQKCVDLSPFQPATFEIAVDDHLNRLESPEFDKAFVFAQWLGHKQALVNLLVFKETVTDDEIKAFISNTIAAVQVHLDKAAALLSTL
jgi:putative membrane protein